MDPLPFFREPAQSPVSTPELYKKYPLIMISGTRSPLFFHSEHRMIPWLREKMPDPFVDIHPDTAKKYGIYDGEWVYIENDLGKVRRKARIRPTVHPKMINTMHGWWMPEEEGRRAEPVRGLEVPDQSNRSWSAGRRSRLRRRPVQNHAGHANQNSGGGGLAMAEFGLLIDYDYCTGCLYLRSGLPAGARAIRSASVAFGSPNSSRREILNLSTSTMFRFRATCATCVPRGRRKAKSRHV